MISAKINKALDLNELYNNHRQGKLLNKQIKFPMLAGIKYDGNYTATKVHKGSITHYTSGGLTYKHTDSGGDIFKNVLYDGWYLAERIGSKGKKGDRVKCNLTGSKADQKSTKHTYKVFDYLTIDEYESGYSNRPYTDRMASILSSGIPIANIVECKILLNHEVLNNYMDEVTTAGWEGLMLMDPNWKWENTKSRKVSFVKYKDRPTADLICVGVTEGEGKYAGLIGALILEDSECRTVNVGSGLSDADRMRDPSYFIDKVIEIKYEQILDTYIQPTYKCIRHDKAVWDIN